MRYPFNGNLAIGLCLRNDHPTLPGRCLVRWEVDGQEVERWLPTATSVAPRPSDHVLLVQPENWPEPIVMGVVDGLEPKVEEGEHPGPKVELLKGEALRVVGYDGRPLLEITQGEKGPVVRLLSEDLELEVPGELRFKAKGIQMEAVEGEIQVKASADVVVRGEVIRLN